MQAELEARVRVQLVDLGSAPRSRNEGQGREESRHRYVSVTRLAVATGSWCVPCGVEEAL